MCMYEKGPNIAGMREFVRRILMGYQRNMFSFFVTQSNRYFHIVVICVACSFFYSLSKHYSENEKKNSLISLL